MAVVVGIALEMYQRPNLERPNPQGWGHLLPSCCMHIEAQEMLMDTGKLHMN